MALDPPANPQPPVRRSPRFTHNKLTHKQDTQCHIYRSHMPGGHKYSTSVLGSSQSVSETKFSGRHTTNIHAVTQPQVVKPQPLSPGAALWLQGEEDLPCIWVPRGPGLDTATHHQSLHILNATAQPPCPCHARQVHHPLTGTCLSTPTGTLQFAAVTTPASLLLPQGHDASVRLALPRLITLRLPNPCPPHPPYQ